MASPKRYEITFKSAMMWANAELEHVGRIASVMDPDIQYAYAMSTLNGMAHLKDALFELVTDPEYTTHRTDLQKTHDAVIRTMRHLKAEYNLDLDAIRTFNTRGTLSDLGYLEDTSSTNANSMGMNHIVDEGEYASSNTVSQNGGLYSTKHKTKRSHKRTKRSRSTKSRRH